MQGRCSFIVGRIDLRTALEQNARTLVVSTIGCLVQGRGACPVAMVEERAQSRRSLGRVQQLRQALEVPNVRGNVERRRCRVVEHKHLRLGVEQLDRALAVAVVARLVQRCDA